jgi:hypothetical protein
VRFLWDEGEVTLHPEQRRYMRVETDAASQYHNVGDPARSRFNFIATGSSLRLIGTTPLKGGRMRVIIEATKDASPGMKGGLRVELSRTGLSILADERSVSIVERPEAKPATRRVSLPPFDVRPVEGPEDPLWAELGWPDDTARVACTAEMEQGLLVVHYSTFFPKFASRRIAFEKRDPALSRSFVARYQIWLAVHSLLLHADQEGSDAGPELPETDSASNDDQPERIRMATLAALFASREVAAGSALAGEVD